MATPKHASIVRTQNLGPTTRLLDVVSEEPLGFVGGQYVLVDSGLVAPSGKAVKRAYSLLTSDAEQQHFSIAVKRIGEGPGSTFMHGLEAGAALRFSGPWGKLGPRGVTEGRTLVLATDTGVTAAIGLVQSGRFQALVPDTTFIWLRSPTEDFLPDAFVRARVPAHCETLHILEVPPPGDPQRVPDARRRLARVLEGGRLEHAFLAGDGVVNYALLDELNAAGVPATRDHVESFFNMPKKSS